MAIHWEKDCQAGASPLQKDFVTDSTPSLSHETPLLPLLLRSGIARRDRSARAQFTLDLTPASPGTGALTFTLEQGFFYSVEGSTDLTAFTPLSGWMLGDGSEVAWPIHYPISPASNPATAGATRDVFSIYPFANGKSLVTWDGSGGTLRRALIEQDFTALPPPAARVEPVWLSTLPGISSDSNVLHMKTTMD